MPTGGKMAAIRMFVHQVRRMKNEPPLLIKKVLEPLLTGADSNILSSSTGGSRTHLLLRRLSTGSSCTPENENQVWQSSNSCRSELSLKEEAPASVLLPLDVTLSDEMMLALASFCSTLCDGSAHCFRRLCSLLSQLASGNSTAVAPRPWYCEYSINSQFLTTR